MVITLLCLAYLPVMVSPPVFILILLYYVCTYISIGNIDKLTHVYLCIFILAHVIAMCYNKDSKGVDYMPAICIFYGIIIRMYNEKGGKHHKPHIHAEYQGKEIVIALDGEILEDSDKFPKNKLKLIDAWMEIHREDLEANWQLLSEGQRFFKIPPLQ